MQKFRSSARGGNPRPIFTALLFSACACIANAQVTNVPLPTIDPHLNRQNILAAFSAARSSGARHVVFPAGVYRVAPDPSQNGTAQAVLPFNSLVSAPPWNDADYVIEGDPNGTILEYANFYANYPVAKDFLRLWGFNNLTIKNITFRHAPGEMPFVSGTVVGRDSSPSPSWIDFEVTDPDLVLANPSALIVTEVGTRSSAGTSASAGACRLVVQPATVSGPWSLVQLNPPPTVRQLLRLNTASTPQTWNGPLRNQLSQVAHGDTLIINPANSSGGTSAFRTLDVRYCRETLRLENVTMHEGGGIYGSQLVNLQVVDCSLTAAPGKLVGSTQDWIHVDQASGHVVIESCDFANPLDECVNVHVRSNRITDAVADPNGLEVELQTSSFMGGIYWGDTLDDEFGGPSWLVVADELGAYMGAANVKDYRGNGRWLLDSFDPPSLDAWILGAAPSTFWASPACVPKSVTIQGCSFRMAVDALRITTPNTVVRDCIFEDQFGEAITAHYIMDAPLCGGPVGPEMLGWARRLESIPTPDVASIPVPGSTAGPVVVIEDNSFVNSCLGGLDNWTGKGVIDVVTKNKYLNDAPAPDGLRGFVIRNNSFVNSGNAAIKLLNAMDLEIGPGNRFANTGIGGLNWTSTNSVLFLDGCEGVTNVGNTLSRWWINGYASINSTGANYNLDGW